METPPTSEIGDHDKWPAVDIRRNPARREWNLLIRRPFYMNLRISRLQNALWIGKTNGHFVTVFNRLRSAEEV